MIPILYTNNLFIICDLLITNTSQQSRIGNLMFSVSTYELMNKFKANNIVKPS